MRKSGLAQGTWVLVADGEKALFLVNEGDAEDMNLVVRGPATGPDGSVTGLPSTARRFRTQIGTSLKKNVSPRICPICSTRKRTREPLTSW